MLQEHITKDLQYLLIFSLVLIVPKLLIKFKIPSGITALFAGLLVSTFIPEFQDDSLFRFLSQIGITSLFVFAGLEVDFDELKADKVYLSKYILKYFVALSLIAIAIMSLFSFNFQNSLILSLGIFTPSAGFILTSLHAFKVNEDQEYWVKSKAISKEVLSILLLFLALQGGDIKSLSISIAFFAGLFIILPTVFRFFFKYISPYAPNSEIPFLVALSLVAGVISKELGAYYLVGAFAVGLVGARFKKDIFHEGEEVLFRSLSGFFSVFLPFYFFYAGLGLSINYFGIDSLKLGALMLVIFVPLRLFLISNSIKRFMKDDKELDTYKISFSLMPTLIFGLVISNILLNKNEIPTSVVYGLIIYTLFTSILPSLFFFNKKNEA